MADGEIDFRTLYLLLLENFDDLQLAEHVPVLERHIADLADGKLPEDHKDELLKQFLPKFLVLISRKSDKFTGAEKELNAVFRLMDRILEAMISLVASDVPQVFEILQTILNPALKLYTLNAVESQTFFATRSSYGNFEFIDPKEYYRSRLVPVEALRKLEHFATCAGFDTLLSRLGTTTPVVPVPLLKRYLEIFAKARDLLKGEFATSYIAAFQDAIFKCYLSMNEDELKQVKKSDIEDLINTLEMILNHVLRPEEIAKRCEGFCLDFSIKCFRTTLIEKRVNGLVYIEDSVESAMMREMIGDNNRDPYNAYARVTKWIRADWLVKWIQENGILQSLFDANTTHPELLAHSHRIISFMASRGQLSRADLELLWSCVARQHLTHAIFDLLSAVCVELKSDHATFFWQKLASLRTEDWTDKLVAFVGRLARQSSAWEEATQLLWKLFQDSSSSSTFDAKVESAAIDKYLEVVTGAGMKPKRGQTLEQLLVYIKEHISVAQHCLILRKMLEELPVDAPASSQQDQPASRSQFIAMLNQKHPMLNLLATEFGQYVDDVIGKVKASATADVCGTVFVGRYLHRENLQRRLDCLRVVITSSSHVSGQELKPVVDLIWQRLFELAITDEEKQMCFNWFTKLVPSLPVDTINYIFDTWLSAPAVCHFIASKRWAFACMRTFFLSINSRATPSGGKPLNLKANDDFEVASFGELNRVDALWRVACMAKDKVMREDSSAVLIKLYSRFPTNAQMTVDELVQRRRSMARLFVDAIMPRYQKSAAALSSPEGISVAERGVAEISIDSCSFLLRSFLNQSAVDAKNESAEFAKASAPPPAAVDAASVSSSLNVTLTPRDKDNIKQVVDFMSVSPGIAWAALQRSRGSIEGAVNILLDPNNLVVLTQEGSKYETKAVKPAAAEEPKPAAAAAPAPPSIPTDLAGTYIVDSSEYFSLMFSLLDLEGIDKTAVWDIIHHLPRNTQMETNLRDLQPPVQWKQLLDSSSAHRLSYSLKIVAHLMAPNESTSLEASQAWCKKFFHTGGFVHLYHLLKEMQVEGVKLKDPHYKSCLTLLLSVIEHFVKDNLVDLSSPSAASSKRSLALSRASAEQLEKTIDFSDFVKSLTNLLVALTYLKSHDSTDVKLVQHTTFLLTSSLISRPELLQEFFSFQTRLMLSGLSASTQGTLVDIEVLIADVLLRREGILDDVRRQVASNFANLCKHYSSSSSSQETGAEQHNRSSVDPTLWLLPRLIRRIPRSNDDKIVGSGEHFFWLIEQLLALNVERQEMLWTQAGSSVTEFFSALFSVVQSRPGEESESHEDRVSIGCLRVLAAISRTHPSIKSEIPNLVDEILQLCFSSDASSAAKVKFRSRRTRSAAFAVLTTLIEGNLSNLLRVIAVIAPYHVKLEEVVPTWEPPKLSDKSLTGYVGMKNLGSTCYMNSVMQQFFMIPQLRSGVISTRLLAEVPADAIAPENLQVLTEMQRMFAYLQDSDRQYFDPESFGKACKLEIGVQQDADEFFNFVTDRLDHVLKATEQPRLLKDVFGGTTSNELACSANPDHVTKNTEEFMTLSVDIENKSDLSQALTSFFQGETISNYNCDRCNKKVDVVKRVALDSLPNTLIVHLKRFRFHIERLQKEKLQHCVEFPMNLNVRQYCSEHTAHADDHDDKFEYALRGIVVHTGNAEGGHYYCIIKDKNSGAWFKFDDMQVLPFEESDIPAEAFGSNEPAQYSDRTLEGGMRHKSGYMLLYDRVATSVLTKGNTAQTASVSDELRKMIDEDNIDIGRQRMLFDHAYMNFVLSILKNAADLGGNWKDDHLGSALFPVFQLGCFFMFETVLRARERELFVKFGEVLGGVADRTPLGCKWLLHDLTTRRGAWLRYALFETSEDSSRTAVANLIVACIKSLTPIENDPVVPLPSDSPILIPPAFLAFSPDPPPAFGPARAGDVSVLKTPALSIEQLKSTCVTDVFVDHCFRILEWTRQHWRRFPQFFGILKEVSLMSHRNRQLMHRCDAISAFIDYFMGKYSPEWTAMEQQTKTTKARAPIADFEKKLYPDLSGFMVAFAACMRSVKTSQKAHGTPETAFSDCPLLEMSERSRPLFFDREMLVALFKMGYNVEANLDIAAHVSWNDVEHSALVLSCCSDGILKSNQQMYLGHILPVFDRVLKLNDDLMFWRVAALFQTRDYGYLGILKMVHDTSLVDMLIEWLVLTMRSLPLVIGWLLQSRETWRSSVLDLVSSRIKSLKSSGAPEQRIHAMQENFAFIEQVASDTLPESVEHFWDDSFSFTDYAIHSIPKEPRNSNHHNNGDDDKRHSNGLQS